ncbi:MAG: hypothetical protein H7144_08700 [Burkholderiales bacterium]|nr:hypothetical protein [Phycisphaerae bacterium]
MLASRSLISLLAVAILMARVLCVCAEAAAPTPVAPDRTADEHACCQKQSEPVKQDCPNHGSKCGECANVSIQAEKSAPSIVLPPVLASMPVLAALTPPVLSSVCPADVRLYDPSPPSPLSLSCILLI